MNVVVTSSNKTRAPYCIETLLIEIIALNCTAESVCVSTRGRDAENGVETIFGMRKDLAVPHSGARHFQHARYDPAVRRRVRRQVPGHAARVPPALRLGGLPLRYALLKL